MLNIYQWFGLILLLLLCFIVLCCAYASRTEKKFHYENGNKEDWD